MTTDEYFVFKTHVNSSGCWIWTGRQNAQGYGSAAHDGLKMTAHRLSYEYFNGPIPQGLVVRHKCDVRLCVNPDHLDIGTRADNNRDTSVRDRTGNAKLTNADVVDIRWVHGLGASGAAIARAYNVTSTTISQIVNNQSRLNAR